MSENTDADELATGVVETIVAGTNVDNIDSSDPANPIVNVTTPASSSVQGAKVNRSTNQVETSGTYTVDFTTEDYDDNSFADLGTDADRLTVPSGVTRCNVSAYVRFGVINDNSRVRILINRHNSSDAFQETVAAWEGQTGATFTHISCAAFGSDCVATDFYEVAVQCEDTTTTISEASFVIQDVT